MLLSCRGGYAGYCVRVAGGRNGRGGYSDSCDLDLFIPGRVVTPAGSGAPRVEGAIHSLHGYRPALSTPSLVTAPH